MSRIRSFFREAKRRRIHTTTIAYVVVAGGTIQLASSMFPALGLPDLALTFLIAVLALALPIILVIAWIFDIGPGGFSRTEPMLGADNKSRAPGPTGGRWEAPVARAPVPAAPKPVELPTEAPEPERVRRATLAFVRHELRTPINAIIGYSEMLQEDAASDLDHRGSSDLGRIVRCGRDILALVDGILDADRISAERGRELDSYGEQLRVDLRDPLSAIMGYTEMLIETSREDDRTSRIGDLDRVLAASRKLLELSNDIVELAMHANAAVPAEMMRGATMAEGVLSKIRAVNPTQAEPDRQGSLLVVDDSPMNRDLLARQLARKGYFVTTAESGAEALELMSGQHFDLVLLDVLMPDLDGVGVLLRMKGDARLADTPVIMISALDEIDSVVRCLELGAADFVSKPFHPTLLDARINVALQAHAAKRFSAGANTGAAHHPAISRMVAGSLPDYVLQRLQKGETRLLDGATLAAAYFVDVDHAVAASNPAERAELTETLIEAAHRAGAQEGSHVLLHGIGLVMVAGFPEPDGDAAARIARTALAFSREVEGSGIRLRSGMHLGEVFAAVVGKENLSYWVWGDAIDLSRRLALSADRGSISVSAACYAALKDEFDIASRGVVEVAGRGQMRAYSLRSEAAVAGIPPQ
ncbi:MAG: response regulator [Longimicrobiales bacterium]